jgi:large subunit ribosomal protein L9
MQVILMERVETLGQMGDVVSVKDGYARNYLLPQRKALRATEANIAHFQTQRKQLEATSLAHRQEAEAVAEKSQGLTVTLLRQASESAQLYGSVTARDVAEAVTAGGLSVDRRQVALAAPIKTLGLHSVRVILHPEVSLTVRVNVARSEAEAEQQASGEQPNPETFFEEGGGPHEHPETEEGGPDTAA